MRILEPGPSLRSIVTRRTLLPPPATQEDPAWLHSWEHLIQTYAPALRRFVHGYLKRVGYRSADADTPTVIVQDFLVKNMRTGQLAAPGREVRKFRAWITAHLRRFVHDWLDHELAAKRQPRGTESAETLKGVPSDEYDPALASFDKGLVTIAMTNALKRLRGGEGAAKWGGVYADIIQDLILTGGEGSPDLHERLGAERSKLAGLRHRARRKIGELFVGELRATVRDEQALEELLADLDPFLP